jgi:hypothetical protein
MHELGHNLGLRHGGEDDFNFKPNYFSVMNYSFQTRGLIIDGTSGTFDYSRFLTPDLDETNLDETVGIGGFAGFGTIWYCSDQSSRTTYAISNPMDWNCDGDATDNPTSANINNGPSTNGEGTLLKSWIDWFKIVYIGGAIGDNGAVFSNDPVTTPWTQEIDPATDQRIPGTILAPDLVMTAVSGSTTGKVGGQITISDTVYNVGNASTVYGFYVGFYLSKDKTITTSDIFLGSRIVFSLEPGQRSRGRSTVTIPTDVPVGTYYIGAIADYSRGILEIDENNNALAASKTIKITN